MPSYRNLPVVRSRIYGGKPVVSHLQRINISEVIRRIFYEHDIAITNDEVHNYLAMEGLETSNSNIYRVRRWLRQSS